MAALASGRQRQLVAEAQAVAGELKELPPASAASACQVRLTVDRLLHPTAVSHDRTHSRMMCNYQMLKSAKLASSIANLSRSIPGRPSRMGIVRRQTLAMQVSRLLGG